MASQSPIARRARAGTANDQAALNAAARLTDRDRFLVRVVAEHRVLTTDQLAALAFDNIITARHRLDALNRIGALRRFRPLRAVGSAPWHYLLGPLGAAILGAEDRDDNKWLSQVRAGRQVALQRSQRLSHMTGANWFFVSLAGHARRGDGELRTWLSEGHTAEFFYERMISCPRLRRFRNQTDSVSGPKTAGRSRSRSSTTPAASTWPSWLASSTATPGWPRSCPATSSECQGCCSAS
jgi:Replication-relaxation